jgi:L-fucose isomerase-like protein
MTCLPGLQNPRKHVPPCMSFMTLRDQGFPAGCQSDLSAALTLMLVEYLFDKPGFQQNASMDTEANLYFGAHCTCPAYMGGRGAKPEPYILRNHAEAGWGCVPRVLLKEGQRVTMAQYRPTDQPDLLVYAGEVVRCPETPPVGGCRTNALIRFDGVTDACTVKGMHQVVFYGDYAGQLKDFCQLYGIPVVA